MARVNAAGFRTIVPYLRGYGPTRFLSPDTPRSGQQAALALQYLEGRPRLGLLQHHQPVAGLQLALSFILQRLAVGQRAAIVRVSTPSAPPASG